MEKSLIALKIRWQQTEKKWKRTEGQPLHLKENDIGLRHLKEFVRKNVKTEVDPEPDQDLEAQHPKEVVAEVVHVGTEDLFQGLPLLREAIQCQVIWQEEVLALEIESVIESLGVPVPPGETDVEVGV